MTILLALRTGAPPSRRHEGARAPANVPFKATTRRRPWHYSSEFFRTQPWARRSTIATSPPTGAKPLYARLMETLEQHERRIQRLERQRARRRAKALWPMSIGGAYRPDLPGTLQLLGPRSVSFAKLLRLLR